MSANGLLHRNTKFYQSVAQIGYLFHATFQVIKLRSLVQPHCQCSHVSAIHTAVGDKSFVHNVKNGCFFKQGFIIQGDKSTHVYQSVFFGTDGHAISIGEKFQHDFLNGLMGITLFSFFDKIGIFGKAGRIKKQWNFVLFAQGGNLTDVFHRHGLPPCRITGNGYNDQRNLLFGIFFKYGFQFLQVHISFKRMINSGVKCFVYGAIYGMCFPEFDMTFGGIEMGVSGNDVTGFYHGRK